VAENKTKATAASVTEFVAGIEDEGKRRDARTVMDIMRRVTGEKPKMWGPSIIGFGSLHYRYETGREGDAPLVGFSPRKAALVLYGAIGFPGAPEVLSRLGKHTTGKGCLYIKRMSDVNADVLKELIETSAAARESR
jgi:hypothetical protein